MTCLIALPEGMNEENIDIDSIQITRISIEGVGDFDLDPPISRAPGSPSRVFEGKLMSNSYVTQEMSLSKTNHSPMCSMGYLTA